MHIALKIGLYAVGSILFLGVAQHFIQPEETKNSPGTTDKLPPTVPTEKAVLNTKVSTMDLDSVQMKQLLSVVTKDAAVGSLLVGTKSVAKMI